MGRTANVSGAPRARAHFPVVTGLVCTGLFSSSPVLSTSCSVSLFVSFRLLFWYGGLSLSRRTAVRIFHAFQQSHADNAMKCSDSFLVGRAVRNSPVLPPH